MNKKLLLLLLIGMISVNYAYAINESNSLYDLTNISQSPDLYTFVKEANLLTGQILMSGLLLIGFIIFFISMKGYGNGNREALIASSFLTTAIGVLFSALNFISSKILIMLVIGFTFMFSMLFFESKKFV